MTAAPSPVDRSSWPHLDTALPTATRVRSLLDRMTVAEKVGQMLQLDARGDLDDLVVGKLAGSLLHASPARIVQAGELTQRTRLQIPLLMADDAIHGHSFWPGATIFGTQLNLACTWDPDLLHRIARAAAAEIAPTGLHWTFSPVLCITRDLRWGRVDETFGEDPFLIGELGAAMVRGYQGDGPHDRTAVLATAKHFAGYSETQGGRDASEADLSPRKLRSWFLEPFRQAVEAGCATVMLGYQAIDGTPVTVNHWLLSEVLRGEWSFRGTLVTDWDNVGRMVWEQKVCSDDVEAATVAVTAGNDLVMSTPGFFEAAQTAVAEARLSEADLDRAVGRILALKFDLGLFEDPRYPDADRQATTIGCAAHTDLNLDAARQSLVLLGNPNGMLPLDPAKVRRIAVVGPNADDPHAQLGDWAGASGQVDWIPDGHPRALTATVLDGIRASAPPDWVVTHTRGADIGRLVPDPAGVVFQDGQPRPRVFVPAEPDPELIADAVQAAAEADVVVAVVGDTVALTGEGRSTATLELQGGQLALLDALLAVGTQLVVVLVQSKPSVLPTAVVDGAAVVQAFNPGMQGGRAIAELLLGHIEPAGRLPVTIARHVGQLPVYYNQIRGQHGDRYADLTQEPLYPFGFGLTYTTVEYSDLRITDPRPSTHGNVEATVTVTNRGDRPAVETVQAYVRDVVTSVTWAELELKAFRRVTVAPHTSVELDISVPVRSCSLVDADGARVVEPGDFDLLVGPDSRRARTLTARFTVTPTDHRPEDTRS